MDDDLNLAVEVGNYLGEKRALISAIKRAALAGKPSARIESAAAPAFSRDQVRQFVAAVRFCEAARKILKEAGLGDAADLRVTGFDPPREVRLNLCADPDEDGYETLPDRVREAFRNFATLELIPRHHDDSEKIDDLLRDGEPVRLTRQKQLP